MSKEIIEKLKNGEHMFCKIGFRITSQMDFTLYEEYYNEDKTKKIKSSYKYCPELYMSKYEMSYFNAKGIMYYEGSIFLVSYDEFDYQYEYAFIEDYFDKETYAINNFYKKNKDYIILKDRNEYYTISQFFSGNTKEKVIAFIEKMNSFGNKFEIVKGAFKEDEVVEDE